MYKALYVDVVRDLYKATGNKVPRKFISTLNDIHDKQEPHVRAFLLDWFKKYRTSLKRRLTQSLAKADDEEQRIRAAVKAAMGDVAAQFPDLFESVVQDVVDNITSLGVTPDFHLVNQRVQVYLRNDAANYFTTLSNDEVAGIHSAIADAMASDERYTMRSVIGTILDNGVVYSGNRQYDPVDWAAIVARTETARAASTAQRESLQDVGLQSWQWQVQDTGCDDCDENDDQIVAMGDEFDSGDDAPPAHPNCRCVCIPVMDELTSLDDSGGNSDDPEDDNAIE